MKYLNVFVALLSVVIWTIGLFLFLEEGNTNFASLTFPCPSDAHLRLQPPSSLEFYSKSAEDLECQKMKTMHQCLSSQSPNPALQRCVWCSSLSLCIFGNHVNGSTQYKTHCPYWCGNGLYASVDFQGLSLPNQRSALQNALLISSMNHLPFVLPRFRYPDGSPKAGQEINFDELYDENYLIESLRNTTCVFRHEEMSHKVRPDPANNNHPLEAETEPYVLGWFVKQAINAHRKAENGFILFHNVFGLTPERPEEQRVQHLIFDGLRTKSVYLQLAHWYSAQLQEMATKIGIEEEEQKGEEERNNKKRRKVFSYSYSATHLCTVVDNLVDKRNPDHLAYILRTMVDSSTRVMYVAVGDEESDPNRLQPFIDQLCANRPWRCIWRRDLLELQQHSHGAPAAVEESLFYLVEIELMTRAKSTVLEKFSTMSWVVKGEREKQGIDTTYWGQPTWEPAQTRHSFFIRA
eukprot:TRINITY_DN1591_c0_g1_i1.p1 TRINITY_DN1591_c0_g1~~TRINITY_DN1591_c0_g1_i1.p1  ORF type:complete len:464 (+),score=91.25 TRINITY_DN1591_c0_g1_i1:110-1501(+)